VIVGETSYSLVEGKVSALSDGEWSDARELITAYNAVKDKRHIAVTGKVNVTFSAKAKQIREDMRVILGLNPLTDNERMSFPGSVVVISSVRGW
jgi:hypothetical protein